MKFFYSKKVKSFTEEKSIFTKKIKKSIKISSVVSGGSFGSGFYAGAVSSLVSSGVQKIGDIGKGINYTSSETLTTGTITKSFAQNNSTLMKVITIASGGLSGGFSSAIAGGNFWQGVKQGIITSGLNHATNHVVMELKDGGKNGNQGQQNQNELSEEQKNAQNNYKKFLAIVAGESTDNIGEAIAIGEVILRRMEHVGTNFSDNDFVSKIGGAGQYDAIGESHYNTIMEMSMQDINDPMKNPYWQRTLGARIAYSTKSNLSNGAFFWNATSQKNFKDVGFNWRQFNKGTFVITNEIGGTTFFKYNNSKKSWP